MNAKTGSGLAVSPALIAEHELFHANATEEMIRTADDVVRESMTVEEYVAMYERYRDAYAGIYDFETMSVDEIERLLTEEITADAYAGLNFFYGRGEIGDAIRAETQKSAPAQRAEAQQETTGPPEGKAQAFVGYDEETGRGIYRSNFEENTPKAQKSERVIRLIQDVWSKNPIDLVVENEDGSKSIIKAEFDPDFDEVGGRRSDASKLAGGNRHGTASEKRVTLNLADDFYRIIQESTYSRSKAETGKASETHTGVNTWRYFVNPILYMERSGSEMIPYTVSIDVKQKDNGNFVYSFHAERDVKNNGQPAPQTLHAAVNGAENDTANGLPIKESIADTVNAPALTQTPEAPAGTASFDPTIRSNSGKSQEKSSGRASIVVLPDGKKYVQADRQVIFGNDPASWAGQIEGYINRKIRSGEDVILTTDSGDVLKITKDTAGKASFRNYVTDENGRRRPMTDSEYEAKLNAEAHIDELARVSERINKNARSDETSADGRPIHGKFAENGWLYREAWFQDFDGQYYRVTISIADGDNGVVVYNVGDMKRRGSPANIHGSSDSVTETGAQQGKSSSTVTIRQTEGNSQEKSSGRASVEVESRATDNETGSSDDKKPSFDNETARAFVKSYSALQRVVDERTAAYQEATKANDPNYDYETESKWLSKASQELEHCELFHAQAVRLIREYGEAPNEAMRAVWEYEYDRIMEREAMIRMKLGLYDGR